MLTCAIPECQAQEHFLRSGTLHLLDVPQENRNRSTLKKMVWLCTRCSATYVVQSWREPGQQIRLRPRTTLPTLEDIISARVAAFVPKPAKRSDAGTPSSIHTTVTKTA